VDDLPRRGLQLLGRVVSHANIRIRCRDSAFSRICESTIGDSEFAGPSRQRGFVSLTQIFRHPQLIE
jgi:hypothetical protein